MCLLRLAALCAVLFVLAMVSLAGCVAWNQTGTWRAEHRAHRLFRPGMTADDVRDVARRERVDYYPPDEDEFAVARFHDVQTAIVGTANVVIFVHFDEAGRVREVRTRVDWIWL